MMHSVESRFIAIVCSAMLVFVAPLLALFLAISSERVARERLQNVELLMEASGEALGKPIWDFDQDGIERIALSLMNASDIRAVTIRDTAGNILAALPPGSPGAVDGKSLETAISYDSVKGPVPVGALKVVVPTSGLLLRFSKDEWTILGILLFAVATVFAAALIGNRFIVIRPLMRLTAAVEATRRLGSRHRVDWNSDDEMGALAGNFNAMQDRLEREEKELKSAHARATETYNLTPAMLFSLDAAGRLSAVSDYWLLATGYLRDEVIGRSFTDFIDPSWHEAYHQRSKAAAADGHDISDLTLPFRKADGEFMTVLILETETSSGEISLSVMTDVTALKQAESRNHTQAITDHLTGLLNRQGFENALDEAILSADQCDMQLACLFIDLDRFKWINDNFGHAAGDAVLRQTVERIQAALRPEDVIARLGGDEFAILIADDEPRPQARLRRFGGDRPGKIRHRFPLLLRRLRSLLRRQIHRQGGNNRRRRLPRRAMPIDGAQDRSASLPSPSHRKPPRSLRRRNQPSHGSRPLLRIAVSPPRHVRTRSRFGDVATHASRGALPPPRRRAPRRETR